MEVVESNKGVKFGGFIEFGAATWPITLVNACITKGVPVGPA